MCAWLVSLMVAAHSGCGQEEIDELARRYNAWLPADYISFLRIAGKVAPRLWSGSDFTLDQLDDMQGARRANSSAPWGSDCRQLRLSF